MRIQRTKRADYFESIANEYLAGREGIVVCINDNPCVWTGELDTLDLAACQKHNMYVGHGKYIGGSIVNMPGDLSICITTWGDSNLALQIVNKAATWLSERGVNITSDKNDILADEKKVISWAKATTLQGWCQSVVHFSVGQMDLDLIKEICTKPMIKEPGALSLYGLTAEMIWNEIKEVIDQNINTIEEDY